MPKPREKLKSEGDGLVGRDGLVAPGQPLLEVAWAEEVIDHDGTAAIGGGGHKGQQLLVLDTCEEASFSHQLLGLLARASRDDGLHHYVAG